MKTADVTLTALMAVGFAKYPPGPGVRKRAGLAVDYTLVNTGQRSLAAYDRVPDDLGSAALGQVNPEHAWVYMSGPVLRVSKQSFDTAPNVRFAVAPVTGIRPLPAGGSLTGRAWVPLPPTLDVPGKNFVSPGGRGLALDLFTWQFCVQIGDLAERTGPVTDAVPDSAAPGEVVRSAPASAPQAGELICTEPVPLVTP